MASNIIKSTTPHSEPHCWIETTVRCKGGKNMDGMYVLGHYPTLAAGREALAAHLVANPKAFAMLTGTHDCPAE